MTTPTAQLLERPDADQTIVPFPRPARFTAPARFDVHEVPAFDAWLAARREADTRHVVVDCSAVRFIDLAAVEAIDAARLASGGSFALADASDAVRITYELLAAGQDAGHTKVAA